MAELSYPNPAVTQLQHERLMGVAAPSGVFGHPADQAVVYAPNSGTREVRIRTNRRAIVQGYGWENDAAEVVKNLAANSSGAARVDLVVLRLNRATWTVTLQVVQGTPGSGAPAVTTGTSSSGVWELPLAEVTVASGATTLAADKVTNRAWYIGADGQYRCTPTTRPPHEAGRTIWEHPTGRYLVSTGLGGKWLTSVEDSGPTSVNMVSGYSAIENNLQRRNGVCVLNLKVMRTNGLIPAGSTTKVANLPDGFAPAVPVQSGAMYWAGAQVAGLRVTAAGVYVVAAAGVSIAEDRTVDGQLVWFVG